VWLMLERCRQGQAAVVGAGDEEVLARAKAAHPELEQVMLEACQAGAGEEEGGEEGGGDD